MSEVEMRYLGAVAVLVVAAVSACGISSTAPRNRNLVGWWHGPADTVEIHVSIDKDSVSVFGFGWLATPGGDSLPITVTGQDIPPSPVYLNLVGYAQVYAEFVGTTFSFTTADDETLEGWVRHAKTPFGRDSIPVTLIHRY
jgi:hypothetical protein